MGHYIYLPLTGASEHVAESASWPRISIVLTSVYSHVLAADAQHGFNLLHKPYSLAELSHALRSVRRTNDNAMVVTTQRATG